MMERLLLLLCCEGECDKAEECSQERDGVHQFTCVAKEMVACADKYISSSWC